MIPHFYSSRGRLRSIDPLDTGHKLNVHKMFRTRPGRLLNILRTFNLRPMSRGALGYGPSTLPKFMSCVFINTRLLFFYKKNFHKKISLKNSKTLRKY